MNTHSLANIFPMIDESSEEWTAFVTDIKTNGLNNPIVRLDGKILDGRNRERACKQAGIEPRYVDYEKTNHAGKPPIVFVWSENVHRRHLNASQRALSTARRDDLMSEFASQAKAAHAGAVQSKPLTKSTTNTLPISVKSIPSQTHVIAAKAAQVAPSTMQAAITLRKAEAAGTVLPQVVAAVESGKLSVDAAANLARVPKSEQKQVLAHVTKSLKGDAAEIRGSAVKHVLKENARERVRDENRAQIAQVKEPSRLVGLAKFSTIMIDPPWDWGDEGDADQFGRARPDYATMSIEQIEALPVGKLAESDSHMYMWITNRSLPKGFRLLEAWGFRYVTMLTWAKPNFGMGNYFRGQTEHVLFGVRGSLMLKRKDVGTLFSAPRGEGGHSSKPSAFYDLVESCSPGPYLEMFSRSNRKDWTQWGQESR